MALCLDEINVAQSGGLSVGRHGVADLEPGLAGFGRRFRLSLPALSTYPHSSELFDQSPPGVCVVFCRRPVPSVTGYGTPLRATGIVVVLRMELVPDRLPARSGPDCRSISPPGEARRVCNRSPHTPGRSIRRRFAAQVRTIRRQACRCR